MDLPNIKLPPPERDDEPEAKRWRGPLFWNFRPNFAWRNGVTYDHIKPPKSVTFPICVGYAIT